MRYVQLFLFFSIFFITSMYSRFQTCPLKNFTNYIIHRFSVPINQPFLALILTLYTLSYYTGRKFLSYFILYSVGAFVFITKSLYNIIRGIHTYLQNSLVLLIILTYRNTVIEIIRIAD